MDGLVFSLISVISYKSIVEKWVPEIRHYLPRVPIVLVGTHKEESDAFLQCVKGLEGMKRKEPASIYAVHADQMQAQFSAVGHIQLLPRSLLSIRVNQGKIGALYILLKITDIANSSL